MADESASSLIDIDEDQIQHTQVYQESQRNGTGDMAGHEPLYPARMDAEDPPATPEGLPMPATRSGGENETITQQPPPGTTQSFKGNPEPVSFPSESVQYHIPNSVSMETSARIHVPIQEQLKQNTKKAGLCVICSCTNPNSGEPIKNCTALEKMNTCFATKLGFHTILAGSNMSFHDFSSLLQELSGVIIPESCSKSFRFLFYFFGHGNKDDIFLSDGELKRSDIITKLQKMNPNHFKVILFDSCRTDPYEVNMENPIQATDAGTLSGPRSKWENKAHYPYAKCVNTLVINATDFCSKAYYVCGGENVDMKGCGIVTYYFTKLVPTMNESLTVVLVEVRKEVDRFIEQNKEEICPKTGAPPSQVLVYEDRLMGSVCLLAESTGEKRVTPVILNLSTSVLYTRIQWNVPINVQQRIQSFQVVCRDEEDQTHEFEVTQDMQGCAEIQHLTLKPKTKYRARVVAKYEDDFEVESEEKTFTIPDRDSPQNISITPEFLGSSKAVARWNFKGHESDLFKFLVQVNNGEMSEVSRELRIQEIVPTKRTATIQGLRPSTQYEVTVVAVYHDKIEVKNKKTFFNGELQCATSLSVRLVKLNPPKVEIKWEIATETKLPIQHFKVVANTRQSGNCTDEPVVSQVPQVSKTAELVLSPGTCYSLTVETYYSGDDIKSTSMEREYTTPHEDELKPKIRISGIQQNTAVVEVTNPPFFQRKENYHAGGIDLNNCFTMKCEPNGNNKNSEKYCVHDIERAQEHNLNSETDTDNDTPTTPKTLAGLIAGEAYRVKIKMGSSSGDTLTCEGDFTSKNPSWLQTCCYKCGVPFSKLLCFLIIFGCLALVYPLYHSYLEGGESYNTFYILSDDSVQCGRATSLKYEGIDIQGSLDGGSLQGTFNASLVRRHDLKLYSRPQNNITSGRNLTYDHYALLNGWSIYTWEGSVISGNCCVGNYNNAKQTATLHVFLSVDDANRFRDGGSAKHSVLSETITIPAKSQACFRNWGHDSPFYVVQAAYHIFVLHVIANNMNFTSEINILQKYVNGSDYKNTHQFKYNSRTHLSFSKDFRDPTEYVAICVAPEYYVNSSDKLEADYAYIRSHGTPYTWMEPTTIAITAVGVAPIISVAVLVLILIGCKYKEGKSNLCPRRTCTCECLRQFFCPAHCYSRLPTMESGNEDSGSIQ